MDRLRKRPPRIGLLVLEAIALGVDNSVQLAALLGGTAVQMSHTLDRLADAKKIAPHGWLKRKTRGHPLRRWHIAPIRSAVKDRRSSPTRVTPDLIAAVIDMSASHIRPEIAAALGCSISTVQRIQTQHNIAHPGTKEAQAIRSARVFGTVEERIPAWVPDELRERVAKKIEWDGQFLAARWARQRLGRANEKGTILPC